MKLIPYEHPSLNFDTIIENAKNINAALYKTYKFSDIQVIGTGASGASIMTGMMSIEYNSSFPLFIHPILIKKPGEQTYRRDVSTMLDTDWPIVIVDDTIGSGATLINIRDVLRDYEGNDKDSLISKVEVIAIPDADEQKHLIHGLFPNVKLIIS